MFLLCDPSFIPKAASSVYYLFLLSVTFYQAVVGTTPIVGEKGRFFQFVMYFEVNYFVHITQNADIVDIFLPFSYPSDFDLSSIS